MNLIHKMLASAASLEQVAPGDLIWPRIDLGCIDDIQFPVFEPLFQGIGKPIWDRERTVLVADHYLPAATVDQASIVHAMQNFAKDWNLAHIFLKQGIKHQVLAEAGLITPGMLFCATDSHTNTLGALGCFAAAIGPTEMAALFYTGRMWFKVPETIRIRLDGHLPRGVYAKDIALRLLAEHGTQFANYRAIEYTGPLLGALSISERMTLCNMSTEMGAKAAIVAADSITRSFYNELGMTPEYPEWTSDPGAEYAETIELDVTGLEPLVAVPASPSNGVPVHSMLGTPIDQVFIGSCAGGNVVDLAIAAQILRGRRVHPNVAAIVTPASNAIYSTCLASGVIETLLEAGCIVTNPGCGACAGIHMGVLGSGQVRLSSQNRNFVGRGGHRNSQIYLASAATVAASAITGTINDPREFL